MRMIAILLLMLGVMPPNFAMAAPAEKPAKTIVEERFGPAIRKALGSRTTEDDLTLAEELLAAAKDPATSPALLAELADQTFLLASRDPAGFAMAIEAMNLVATTLPDRAAAAREKVIAFLRRQVSSATATEKIPAATRLMTYLVKLADERYAGSDFGGAARFYQQALLAAGDAKVTDLTALKAKHEAAAAREKLEQRIEAAMEALATNPASATASADLLQIFLVELDNPTAAARFIKIGGDDKAKRLVPLAAGKLEDLTGEQCLELGEWYEKHIADASAGAKPALLKRARSFYEQFMLLPGSDGVQQLRAALGVGRMRDAWLKLNPQDAVNLATTDDHGWVDLLAGLELPRYRVTGRWKKAADAITVEAGDEPARLMMPATAGEAYEVTIRFTRTKGDGAVALILPVGEQTCRVVVSGWRGQAAGLYAIEGDDMVDATTGVRRNSTTVSPSQVSSDVEHTFAARVVTRGDQVTIKADLDGVAFLNWTGARSTLSLDAGWSLRDDSAIGIAADHGTIKLHAGKLRSLRGDPRLIAKPTTLAERGTIAPVDGFVELLEIWDAAGDAIQGTWTRTGDTITSDANKRAEPSQTLLPVIPRGDYVLRVRFNRSGKRPGGPIVHLPMSDTSILAVLGGGNAGNTHGLSMVEAKDYSANATTVNGPALSASLSTLLECRASFDDDQAKLEIDLNGEKLIRWEGPRTHLTPPQTLAFRGGTQFGLAMAQGDIVYESVELKMLTGSAKLTRTPTKAAVVDNTPIDLLKLVKPNRHASSGAWSNSDSQLSTTIPVNNDYASITLPVAPQGNYEFKLSFTRTVGRPVITVHLPVGSTGVDLTLAGSDGKSSSLDITAPKGGAAPVTPGGANPNQISSGAVRFVNNTTYSIRARVETTSTDATIKIELDGKPYLHWTGPLTTLGRYSRSTSSNALGITVSNPVVRSSATFSEAEVKMITGEARRLK